MKKQLIKKGVLLAFVLLTIQSLYAQEQNSSRFDITLYSIVNKKKHTKIRIIWIYNRQIPFGY